VNCLNFKIIDSKSKFYLFNDIFVILHDDDNNNKKKKNENNNLILFNFFIKSIDSIKEKQFFFKALYSGKKII
jgi:hypothetical protein